MYWEHKLGGNAKDFASIVDLLGKYVPLGQAYDSQHKDSCKHTLELPWGEALGKGILQIPF